MKITENTFECRKQNNGTITNRGDSVENKGHGNGQSVSRIIEMDNINNDKGINYGPTEYVNRTYSGVGGSVGKIIIYLLPD